MMKKHKWKCDPHPPCYICVYCSTEWTAGDEVEPPECKCQQIYRTYERDYNVLQEV